MNDKPSTSDSIGDDSRTDADRDQLVAYLDGELLPSEVEQVERRLADDTEFHQRLLSLQRTWDLLDQLPRTEPSQTFTQSTVEMVSASLEKEIRGNRWKDWNQRLIVGAAFVLVIGLTAAVGFNISRWRQEQANRELVNDLPVIENMELYRNADNITFLERLEEEGLFVDE